MQLPRNPSQKIPFFFNNYDHLKISRGYMPTSELVYSQMLSFKSHINSYKKKAINYYYYYLLAGQGKKVEKVRPYLFPNHLGRKNVKAILSFIKFIFTI